MTLELLEGVLAYASGPVAAVLGQGVCHMRGKNPFSP
jgi:hypothetical protein